MAATFDRDVCAVVTAHFPNTARLHASAEFQAVFSACRRLSSAHLRLHAQPRLDAIETRLGVAVSKRVDKRAVGRNRIKRLIREFFRQQRQQLPKGDYVFIVKPEAKNIAALTLNAELTELFVKARSLKPLPPPGTMPASDAAPTPPTVS